MFKRRHAIEDFPQYNDAYIGRNARNRVTIRTPLDPIRRVQWPGFDDGDLFSRRARGPWHEVNILDNAVTGSEYLKLHELFEVSLGPYQLNLSRSYISLIQVK